MAEELHDNHDWADRLRSWEKGEEGPQPTDDVWSRLEKSLPEPPPKRRRWPFMLLMLCCGLAGGMLISRWSASSVGVASFQEGKEEFSPESSASAEVREANTILRPAIIDLKQAEIFSSPTSGVRASPSTIVGSKKDRLGLEEPVGKKSRIVGKIPTGTFRPLADSLAYRFPYTVTRLRPLPSGIRGGEYSTTEMDSLRFLPQKVAPLSIRAIFPTLLSAGLRLPYVVQPRQKVRFSVGGGINVSAPRISGGIPQRNIEAVRELSGLASGAYFEGRLAWKNRWGIQLGISQMNESAVTTYRIQRFYDPNQEETDDEGNAVNKYDLSIDGRYSKADTELEVQRTDNQRFNQRIAIRIQAQLEESVRLTQLPLTFTYDIPLSPRLNFRGGGGLAWNRQTVTANLGVQLSTVARLRVGRTRIINRENILKEDFWTGRLTAGVVFRPSTRWEFGAMGAWSYGLGQIADGPVDSASYQRFGVCMGVLRNF